MPGSTGPVARRAIRTPPEGQDTRDTTPTPQNAYCTVCGHDNDRHRRGRCWTDALGAPVARSFTHIDCPCQATDPDLEASIARHPAGKDRRHD